MNAGGTLHQRQTANKAPVTGFWNDLAGKETVGRTVGRTVAAGVADAAGVAGAAAGAAAGVAAAAAGVAVERESS